MFESPSQLKNTGYLLLAALIWGAAFVAQSVGADYIPAFTFLAIRSWLAFLALLPVLLWNHRRKGQQGLKEPEKQRKLLLGGLFTGFFLFAASAAQQIGIATTTAGKSGFITAMYVVLVPVVSVLLRRRPPRRIWFGMILAVVGLYLLCIRQGQAFFQMSAGDLWTLLAALLFAFQIIGVGHFVQEVDGIALTSLEFLFEALFATIFMLLFDSSPSVDNLRAALPAVAYAGIFSGGIGYTLQTLGERDVNPSMASIAMCMESVFSALFGWLILHEALSVREFMGCAMMICAILVAELPLERLRHGAAS